MFFSAEKKKNMSGDNDGDTSVQWLYVIIFIFNDKSFQEVD